MKRLIYTSIFFIPLFLYSQDLIVLPNGVLEVGVKAIVTGDHVRVRSGPSLEHRILIKVNEDTTVSVLERGDSIENIGDMSNYWYKITIESSGLEGWMYGNFLKKNEEKPETEKTLNLEPVTLHAEKGSPRILLKEIGTISQDISIPTSGDLDFNGIPEIILLNKEQQGGYHSLTGYEPSTEGFSKKYSVRLRNKAVSKIKVFTHPEFEKPLIVAMGNNFSYFYNYDTERNILRLIYKLGAPLSAIGMLDGQNPYIVYLEKNKTLDKDGTVTYFIKAVRIESTRGRIQLNEKVAYPKPLPVKKLLVFDLNNDTLDEIIVEIGGNDFGGGITVLSYDENSIKRDLNSGLNTYNKNKFLCMWGVKQNGTPQLVFYSTDPSNSNDVNTDFGFIWTSLNSNLLHVESFHPVNKMLDDMNNDRTIIFYDGAEQQLPFLFLDFNRDLKQYAVKNVYLD
jgi:hypothetical protein